MNDIENKKRTYECLSFIHSILTQRTQYFCEEFQVADSAAKMITTMANRLAEELKDEENTQVAQAVQND